MTQSIKTLAELLAELPDNTVRFIKPKYVRDVVVSLLGALEITDPTGSDDNVGTAGNGSFDDGQTWMNTLAKSAWICFDGSPLTADWAEIQLVRNLPPPADQIFTARLASLPTPARTLSASLIPVIYGSNSYEVELFNPSDIQFIGLGDLVEFASGRTPATIIKYITSPYIGFITSNNSTLPSSTDTATVTPYANDWFETIGNSVNSALIPKPGGRSGTITTAPAIQMGYQASRGTTDSDVWMRFRGTSSGLPVFDYEAMGIPFSAVYNYGAPSQTVPTVFNFYGSASAPTTIIYNNNTYPLVQTWISFSYTAGLVYPPCSMTVSSDCQPVWIDTGGTPQQVITTGTGTFWIEFNFSHSSTTTTIGGNTYYLGPFVPVGCVVLRAITKNSVVWSGVLGMQAGFVKLPANTGPDTYMGNVNSSNLISTFLFTAAAGGIGGQQGFDDGLFQIAIRYQGSPITAGACKLQLEVKKT